MSAWIFVAFLWLLAAFVLIVTHIADQWFEQDRHVDLLSTPWDRNEAPFDHRGLL